MPDTSPIRVLIADDQADILNALRLLLGDEGYEVIEARSPQEAERRLKPRTSISPSSI
jgi:CheY-like chemotaxis protein